jgi:hypothetical protein
MIRNTWTASSVAERNWIRLRGEAGEATVPIHVLFRDVETTSTRGLWAGIAPEHMTE